MEVLAAAARAVWPGACYTKDVMPAVIPSRMLASATPANGKGGLAALAGDSGAYGETTPSVSFKQVCQNAAAGADMASLQAALGLTGVDSRSAKSGSRDEKEKDSGPTDSSQGQTAIVALLAFQQPVPWQPVVLPAPDREASTAVGQDESENQSSPWTSAQPVSAPVAASAATAGAPVFAQADWQTVSDAVRQAADAVGDRPKPGGGAKTSEAANAGAAPAADVSGADARPANAHADAAGEPAPAISSDQAVLNGQAAAPQISQTTATQTPASTKFTPAITFDRSAMEASVGKELPKPPSVSAAGASNTISKSSSAADSQSRPAASQAKTDQGTGKGERGSSQSDGDHTSSPPPANPAAGDAVRAAMEAATGQPPVHAAATAGASPDGNQKDSENAGTLAGSIRAATDGNNLPQAAINTAQLIQRMSESELRVGLHSDEFGNIGIRTSLGHDQLAAQITVERSDLGRALSDQVPALQDKLASEHGVNTKILIQDHSAGFSGGLDQGSRNQQQGAWQSQPAQNLAPAGDSADPYPAAAQPAAMALAPSTDTRLDIRV